MITVNEPTHSLHSGKDQSNSSTNGLTIRQEFASRIMAGLVSSLSGQSITENAAWMYGWTPDQVAQEAIIQADALINALNESEK